MLYGLMIAVVLFCGAVLLLRLVMWICGFYREWSYVRSEIERVDDEERRYWLTRRRRLWLSLLPFVAYKV